MALSGFCLLVAAVASAQPVVITYPGSHDFATDKRSNYYVALLDLALSKAGVQYELRPYRENMAPARLRLQLEANDGVNLDWAITSPELERRLLTVRIPLDKGLLGWRLFLINGRDRQLFENIHTLDQLRQLTAGLQRDWSDTAILRANGLKVVDATDYGRLYPMLAANRFQFFPRGVGEVWSEQKDNAGLGLEVEPHLALHYPVFTYFFVSRKNPALAQWLERGLRAAIKDGSFNRLFDQYNGEAIKRANLESRTVFELSNPLMSGAASP